MASDLVVVGVARKTLLTPTAFDVLFRVFFHGSGASETIFRVMSRTAPKA